MTYDDWVTATRPKIQGSQNLHDLMPQDMDFFVFLSSSAGVIGARGQANYAVGNTFQDALAAYRRSKGLKAVSLDLGLILGAGVSPPHTLSLPFKVTLLKLFITDGSRRRNNPRHAPRLRLLRHPRKGFSSPRLLRHNRLCFLLRSPPHPLTSHHRYWDRWTGKAKSGFGPILVS